MAMDEPISNEQNDHGQRANVSVAPRGTGHPATAGDEQPMTKPSLLWFLVPIILIAMGVLLAR
jgi:hypothetical protein